MSGEARPDKLEIKGGLIIRNTALNFLGLSLPLVVGLVAMPLTIRWLGLERFGVMSLVWVVFGYFSYIDLGLSMATTRFVAGALGRRDHDVIPRYIWTTVIAQLGLGSLGGIALALVTPMLAEHILKIPAALIGESKASLYLLALSLPVVLVTASFRGALEARQRFDLVNLVKTPSSILNYALPAVGAGLGFDLPAIILLLILARFLTLLIWMAMVFRAFPNLRKGFTFHRGALKHVLGFGIWVMVSNGVGPFLVYLDRFLIGSLLTVGAVGFYTAPYEGVSRITIVPLSLVMTLFPMFSALQAGQDREKEQAYFHGSVKFLIVTLGFVAVVLIFFAHPLLRIWLGPSFAEKSTVVFQILAAGFFLNSLSNVPYIYLQGIGRSDLVAKCHVTELIVYVPLLWLMIKTWGIAGAAGASAIRAAADMVLLFTFSVRKGGLNASGLISAGTKRAGLAVAALATAGVLMKPVSWRIGAFAALVIAALVVLGPRIFDAREKTWIGENVSRLKARLRG